MDTNRRAAVAAGLLLITATVTDVLSRAACVTPVVTAPDVVASVAANQQQLIVGIVLLLVGALCASGIAVAMYPVLRRHDEALSIGAVGFRLIEGAFYLGIVACLLVLLALGEEASTAGAAGSAPANALAGLVLATRDALGEVSVMAFGIGALMYYTVLYRARLVPSWLSAWGLLAVVALMTSGLLVIAGVIAPMSSPQVILALPIGLQEMVLAAWLIARGFSPSTASAPVTRVQAERAATAPVGAP